jgi:hypothetical protein
MVETNEQIVREAPDIEAYKLGLLQSAKALSAWHKGSSSNPAPSTLRANVGPYLQDYTLGDAQTACGVMRGSEVTGISRIFKKRITRSATRRPLIYKAEFDAGRCLSRQKPQD